MEVIGKVGLERPRAQGKDDLDPGSEWGDGGGFVGLLLGSVGGGSGCWVETAFLRAVGPTG